MSTATAVPNAPDLSMDDYVVIGLATCFIKDDGEVHEIKVVEPIPSASLESLLKGIPTSYEKAIATTVGAVLATNAPQLPPDFPSETRFCEEFANRVVAAARTYKARTVAQAHIPVGTTKADFNYSTERKRVLNLQRIVRTEDNVKQHEYTNKVL
ncbi:MAG: hypothetical protein IGS48_20930 [Oscillatoriales cyanobacterium C42_A2020_001]|nr:hypothetical protein [Leptolyngbyaceae cyanobacterium C42_A2020_001]